jgi:hypothetical protein
MLKSAMTQKQVEQMMMTTMQRSMTTHFGTMVWHARGKVEGQEEEKEKKKEEEKEEEKKEETRRTRSTKAAKKEKKERSEEKRRKRRTDYFFRGSKVREEVDRKK